MSYVDKEVFEKVLSECPEVESSVLENLIYKINKKYAGKIIKKQEVDFKAIRNEAMECCGVWDMFTAGPYKTAVGKYYSYRRAKDAKEGYTIGSCDYADKDKVVVAASKDVKILFLAKKNRGQLRFPDIDNGKTRFTRKGKSARVPEELYLKAKRQALAIMNSRR